MIYNPVQVTFLKCFYKVFFTFASIFPLPRVVRLRFFYCQIALGSENILNMYNIPLRWFFAELRGFKHNKVFTKKVEIQKDFEDVENSTSEYFFGEYFNKNWCRTFPL